MAEKIEALLASRAPLHVGSFIRTFIQNPRNVGAVVPSSRALAKVMAEAANGASRVLELGAGTGPVTRELLKTYSGLVSVELSPLLSQSLASRFPCLDIRNAAAQDVLRELPWEGERVAVVSSLPFKSLPCSVATDILDALFIFMQRNPHSWFIQFTYHLNQPFQPPEGWRWCRLRKVWLNIPPANVWVLQRCDAIPN